MKLYHPIFLNPIEIKENEINVIVIENAKVFSSLIFQLKNQIEGLEGEFIFSSNNKMIDIPKNLDLIIDLFNVEINSKKIINKLYEHINKLSMSEQFYLKTVEVRNTVDLYIENLAYEFNQSICYNDEFDVKAILKMGEVKFYDDHKNIAERITNYIDIMREYCKINSFIFVNLKTFLSQEEIKDFYSYVTYNKINTILFENNIGEKREHIEKYTIIDDDLCLL